MKKLIIATFLLFAANKYYTQTATTFTANNAQITNSLISGGVIEANCIHANDTIVADRDIIANEDVRVSGDIILGGKLVVDQAEHIGITYLPASASSSSVSVFNFGKTVGNLNPIIQNCPVGGTMPSPWLLTSGGYISAVTNPTNQVNASLKMYTAPWNGFGFIELEGVNEVGFANNALEINYFCGRNTHINRNSGLSNGGGWVRMGTQVSMDKHVEIGDPVNGINDANNTALQIHANAGKGIVFKTWDGSIKMLSVDLASSPISPFTVYANGKTVIGTEQVVGSHANALLQVAGKVACKSFYVLKPTIWQDRVFTNSYKLMDLKKVEQFIKTNKRLPGLPSEKEILEDGYDINEMDAKLLEKIENLYLYIINQQKEINELKRRLDKTKNE